MQLDERIIRLIAVGASVTANCPSCLETNVRRALDQGADQGQIAEAIAIGKMVRKGAASRVDKFISALGDHTASAGALTDETFCECGL